MADLYVSTNGSDSNDGGKDSPFRTIRRASTEAVAGTTVHVAPGTYEGGFRTDASGSSGNPIRYVSDVKWGAKIVPGDSSSSYTGWDNRGDNVVISGFEVDGSNAEDAWRIGLYSAGSNSVIENNKVHDIATASWRASDSNGGAGIYGDGYNGNTDITVRDNEVYDIGPSGSSSTVVHGIYHTTSGTIANNRIHDNAGTGIHLWYQAHDVDITNNSVYNSYSGIWVGATSGSADNVNVSGNSIHDNRMYGIAEGGATGDNNSYSGNEVYGNVENWRLQSGQKADAAAPAPDVLDVSAKERDAALVSFVPSGGADGWASDQLAPQQASDTPPSLLTGVPTQTLAWTPPQDDSTLFTLG